MSEAIEMGELRAKLLQDENPISPNEWDQVGILVTWHRNYSFDVDGKKEFGDPQEFLRQAKAGRWVYLPVAMIEHSGISLYEGTHAHVMDPGGWDSGQVGFIYTTRERFEQMADKNLNRWRKRAEALLRSELETWDQYVTGDVYGYVIETETGDHVDSCWGFYGYEYAKQEMLSALKSASADAEAGRKLEAGFAL